MSIKENFEKLKEELKSTPVKIVAVSKYATTSQMIEAYEAGVRDFGENKLQTVTQKWPELPDNIKLNSNWHFIGHLQTNKVPKVAGAFQLIHSVDSVKLAEKISLIAVELNVTQDILLEINVFKEATKYGFYKEDVLKLFPEMKDLDNINIKGLMTMAPFTDDTNIQTQCFQGLRILRDELQNTFNYSLPELSMGMSNDYRIAIQEGSTIVRIGQKLFL